MENSSIPNKSGLHQISGFTIIELVISMVITLLVTSLFLRHFTFGLSSVRADRQKTSNIQALSGIARDIADTIKQAGEKIPESTFPALTIDPSVRSQIFWVVGDAHTGNNTYPTLNVSNRVRIARSILTPLTLCQLVPNGVPIGGNLTTAPPYTYNTKLVVATDDPIVTDPGCRTSPIDITKTPNLPINLRAVRDFRCTVPINPATATSDGCFNIGAATTPLGRLSAILSNRAGSYDDFEIYNESQELIIGGYQYQIMIRNSQKSILKPNPASVFALGNSIASADYPIGSPIYISEIKEYVFREDGKVILFVNGEAWQTIASGIESFQVSVKLYADRLTKTLQSSPVNPCTDDPSYYCKFIPDLNNRWEDVAAVRIKIVNKYDPTGRNATPTVQDLKNLTHVSIFQINN